MLAGLLIGFIVSCLVGVLAQRWKQRTGAAWGIMTFVVMIPIWFFLYFATSMAKSDLYKDDTGYAALGFMVSILVSVPMVLIVATLPTRRS